MGGAVWDEDEEDATVLVEWVEVERSLGGEASWKREGGERERDQLLDVIRIAAKKTPRRVSELRRRCRIVRDPKGGET